MSSKMATPSKSRVQLPAQLQAVEDILLWQDVPKAAGALGAITGLYILLEWSRIPLAVWLSNVAIVLVLGAAVWAFAARGMGWEGPAGSLPDFLRHGLDETTVRTLTEKTRVAANQGLAFVYRVLSGNDLVLSFKTVAVLWIVGFVGRLITPVGFVYTVILGLFTLPKIYDARKDQIDQAAGNMLNATAKQVTMVRSRAAEAINKLTPQKGARPGARPAASDTTSSFSKEE